jgi:hypothetical protein
MFSAQICVLKHQNSLAHGEGAKPPHQIPPPRRLWRLDIWRLQRLEFLALHFQNRCAALVQRQNVHINCIKTIGCRLRPECWGSLCALPDPLVEMQIIALGVKLDFLQ